MAPFTELVLKIAFLAILWLFIIIVAVVIHSDMGVGRRRKAPVPDAPAVPASQTPAAKRGASEPWVLAIDSGDRAGERLQLVPEVHIGRSPQCELVLNDDFVSTMHAILRHRSDGTWVLVDAGSTNGTYVNGNRLTAPTLVGVADIIRIGDVQMRLEVE